MAAHRFGEAGETRQGSKHFSAGTKVYILPAQWGDGYDDCVAVGIARGTRRWISVVMSTDLIENWRRKIVYDPIVAKRLADGFQGFNRQWQSAAEIDTMIKYLSERQGGRALAAPKQ